MIGAMPEGNDECKSVMRCWQCFNSVSYYEWQLSQMCVTRL